MKKNEKQKYTVFLVGHQIDTSDCICDLHVNRTLNRSHGKSRLAAGYTEFIIIACYQVFAGNHLSYALN
jgi:hypothetical protein